MKKLFPQLAGAAVVVAAAAAGMAYAQSGADSAASGQAASAPAVDPATDLKSNSTASRYGAGGNNGSTYNPAIRSTDIKAGNVSSVDDPAPTARTATPTPTPPVSSTPSSSTDNSSYTPAAPVAGTATAPAATDGTWNADGTRAARADRN